MAIIIGDRETVSREVSEDRRELIENRTWFAKWYDTLEEPMDFNECVVCSERLKTAEWWRARGSNWVVLWNHCWEQHSDTMLMARLAYTNEPTDGESVYLLDNGEMRWVNESKWLFPLSTISQFREK